MMLQDRPGEARRAGRAIGSAVLVRVGDKQWLVGDDIDQYPAEHKETPTRHAQVGSGARQERTDRQLATDRGRGSRVRGQAVLRSWAAQAFARFAQRLEWLLSPSGPTRTDTRSSTGDSRQAVAARAVSPRHERDRRWAQIRARLLDCFQTGLVIGLILGCISMVVFHALHPATGRQEAASIGSSTAFSVPASAALEPPASAFSGAAVTVPAIRFYGLEVERVSAAAAVAQAMRRWNDRGLAVSPFPDGRGQTLLFATIAINSRGLSDTNAQLQSRGITADVRLVVQPARVVPALAGTEPQTAKAVSNWLATGQSALRTLVASLTGGAPGRDAWTAYRTSRQLLPSDARMRQTGYGPALAAYSTALTGAFQAAARGDREHALDQVVKAYAILQSLR